MSEQKKRLALEKQNPVNLMNAVMLTMAILTDVESEDIIQDFSSIFCNTYSTIADESLEDVVAMYKESAARLAEAIGSQSQRR